MKKAYISILLGIAVIVWGLTLFIRGVPLTIDYLTPFGTVAGTIGFIVFAFDQYFWRQRWLQGWLVKRPNLSGTWTVDLTSDWADPETKKAIKPIKCYVAVIQSYSSLQMHLMTPESDSWVIADRIQPSLKGEGFQIVGVYTNQPSSRLRGNGSEIHYGTMVLDTHGVSHYYPDILTGEYWTDRKTKGEMILKSRRSQVFTRYEDAKRAKGKVPR